MNCGSDIEEWKHHRKQDRADKRGDQEDHERLDHGRKVLEGIVHALVIILADLHQHLGEIARYLSDMDQLGDLQGEKGIVFEFLGFEIF